MKKRTLFSWAAVALAVQLHPTALTAQSFINLNFENANPVSAGSGHPAYDVTTTSALPGWLAYYGSTQQAVVAYNAKSTGAVFISLLNAANGALDGNYSVFLQGGEGSGSPAAASISQTGLIPAGIQSLYFLAIGGFDSLSVLIDNQSIPYIAVQSGPDFSTLYAASISAWAGTTEQLTFSAPSYEGELDNWEIDDISFSQTAVAPEPGSWLLAGVGGLILALRRCFRRI